MKQVDDMPNYAISMMPLVNELADVLGVDRDIAKSVFVRSYFIAERKVEDELDRQRARVKENHD